MFLQVWRRYSGEVGKFYRILWLIYPRHCLSISIKIGVFFMSHNVLSTAM